MISKVGQIMLYVYDQDLALSFWTKKMGFKVIADERNGELRWIELAPGDQGATQIVLHDKALIAKLDAGLNLDAPSLLFDAENLDELQQDLIKKEVTVGDIEEMPNGRTFNFSDPEGNYFAVREIK